MAVIHQTNILIATTIILRCKDIDSQSSMGLIYDG
jgi:hypothetical protein